MDIAAYAAGLVAALPVALVFDDLFGLRLIPDAGNAVLLNLLAVSLVLLTLRFEPRRLAKVFTANETKLRRRLVIELSPLLILFLFRGSWDIDSGALALVALLTVGLRAVSVWSLRGTEKMPSWYAGFLWLPTLALAGVYGGNLGGFWLAPALVMILIGGLFLRDFRRLAATEGIAALPGLLGLLAFAVTGNRWAGVAGVTAWGLGRLWAYSRWLRRRGYGLVMLAAALIAFWMIDGSLRRSPWADALTSRHLSADVQVHDALFWIHKDVFRGDIDFGVARVKIRGREVPKKKTADITRVICCGGSTTFGVKLPPEKVWVTLAEKRLHDSGRRIELLNAGEPGYTAFQIHLLLKHFLVPDYDPDGVILYIGYNDSQLTRGPYTERELYAMWQAYRVGRGTWRMRLGNFLQRSRLYNLYAHTLTGARRRWSPEKVPISTPPEFARTLDELLSYLEDAQIRVLVAAEAHQNDEVIYRRIMKRLARQHHAGFVDVYDLVRRRNAPGEIHTDVVHLTPRGNEIVADIIADAWQNMEIGP